MSFSGWESVSRASKALFSRKSGTTYRNSGRPDLCLKRLKIRQDLGGGGYEIKLWVMLLQVVQKQLGVDDDPILHSAPLGKLLTHCVAFPV